MRDFAKTALTAVLLILTLIASAQTTADSVVNKSLDRINPYHTIKTSIFVEKSLGDYISSGTAIGFEVRKFTGLRHFWFGSVGVGRYRGHNSYRESTPTSYNLSFKTINVKFGTVLGKDLYNIYIGTRYIFDAQLSETFYSFSLARQLSLSGDVTPYINRLLPIVGGALKVRVLKIFIIEGSYELGAIEVFKPLKGKWMAPDTESPFISKQQPTLLRMMSVAVHVKL